MSLDSPDAPIAQAALTPQEAVLYGAQDLTLFGRIFFPKTFRQESPDMHKDMSKRLASGSRQVMFLVFRDGAKTTLLRVFVAQRVSYAISRTIMFVSVSQDHAIHSLRWLKRQIERNAAWVATFGLKPGKKWTDEWIEIENTVDNVTVNILAAGITGQIRGFNLDDFRPDLIVADDILTEENTATEAGRKKMEALFYGGLVNSLVAETEAPWAQIVLAQTPMVGTDLAMKAVSDPDWNSAVYGCFDENGKSRWEAKFPTEKLQLARKNAIISGRYKLWAREKECKIVKSEEQVLNSDNYKFWETIPQGTVRFISIDPASSDKKKADQHVTLAIAVRGPDVYVLAYRLSKGTMPDKASASFFELVTMFAPITRAGAEAIGYQRTLAWYIDTEMRRRRIFVPLERIQDQRSKADRILQHIPVLLAYGHLYIHHTMTELIAQTDDYDPSVDEQSDDILDALAMACRLAGPMLKTPYLVSDSNTLEGEFREINEDEYEPLNVIGGAP